MIASALPTSTPFPSRFFFRAGTVYIVLANLDWTFSLVPGFGWAANLWDRLLTAVCPWVGLNVLGITRTIPHAGTGSGDRTFDYVALFCLVVTSLVLGLIWSGFDRTRQRDPIIHDLLRLSVRYILASSMFVYGWSKVFHLQMPPPNAGRLMEPYGESSPMGLLWTFVGYSSFYSMAAGFAEVLGGVLVLFRRTATLGAIVIFGVMAHVALMNFCFDVPVKIYSTHLVVLSLFLLWPDLRRLTAFFFQNRATPAIDLGHTPTSLAHCATWAPVLGPKLAPRLTPTVLTRLRRTALVLKLLVIAWLTFKALPPLSVMRGDRGKRLDFAGLYRIEKFSRNGESVPLLLTDEKLWQQLAIDGSGQFTLRTLGAGTVRYILAADLAKHELKLTPRGVAQAKPTTLQYEWADGKLTISGRFDGETLSATFARADPSQYLLTTRGFHWINEVPFNR